MNEDKSKLSGTVSVSIENEMQSAYLDYAMSVIVSRALPDCRDGLKPVHRRILFAMNETGNFHDKPYRKSARVIGEVMGKYHPHGDSAIYSALVRMAQDFSLRLPLIDGQGNFGSIDGDSPAQMRYTEVRLAKSASFLLTDIDKDTIDFQDNYDGSEREPKVLPSRFPNLLVNGASGIAVGMATSIPTHNLGEVIDGCCALIDNSEISDQELIEFVPAPDFPTGGEIINGDSVKSALLKGRGSVVIRGKTAVEEKNGKESIIISEIPYQVNKAEMLKAIENLVREKVIEGISEIRDETNKLGIRVVIDLKREANPDVILNQLYQNTQLQNSFSINILALNDGKPEVMGVRAILSAFINFRKEVIKRRTTFLLNKARTRAHLLIGLAIAVANIDEIIALIKSSADTQAAKINLMSREWKSEQIIPLLDLVADHRNEIKDGKCFFTEEQAKAILEMKLHRLTALEKGKIDNELKDLAKIIKEYLDLLFSDEKLVSLIKEELLSVKSTIATPRKTVIKNEGLNVSDEDLIQKEDMVVTLTKTGFIKRVPLAVYRAQRRGGKGRSAMTMYEDDIINELLVTNTHVPLLFFSSMGKVYKLKVYKLPISSPQSKGRAVVNLLPLEQNDSIASIMPMPENIDDLDKLNIIFSTQKGNARRNKLSDFTNIQANGKIAIKLSSDDKLVAVSVCEDQSHILLATRKGKAVRFSVESLRVFKSRASDGVKAAKLSGGKDTVVSMSILNSGELDILKRDEYLKVPLKTRLKLALDIHNKPQKQLNIDGIDINKIAKEEQFILTITENGYGKRTSAYEYRVTNRNSQGVLNIDTGNRNGYVVSSFPVEEDDQIMLMTNLGTIIRTEVNKIRVTSRNAKGVKIIDLNKGEKVVSISKISISIDERE
ncbi:DNA gyrase subunit A [Rickettsiales endosymbiont of Trichoplax sp. H2]|uniref:DNA gyrase subunit A n=1 Tax=Rickettsiales endosymbiont of Trichoplax sp. H2 TaxID=2021221 RepID=UPI001D395782|nr:DNA gyrase subunit A [Rickettsiales endosymbiont of Trichoplax sp. H2]MSO14048.1 DNA gyrase subunit A [Rickettsiales endosymbiont of Trichoplax sp. H2]